MIRLLLLTALCATACRSSPPATTTDPTPPPESPSLAGTADAAVVGESEPDMPAEPRTVDLPFDEEVAGPDGWTVRWSVKSHKHGENHTLGIKEFVFSDGTSTESYEVRHRRALWAEGHHFGQSWRIDETAEGLTITFLVNEREPLVGDDWHEVADEALPESVGENVQYSGYTDGYGVARAVYRDSDHNVVAEIDVGRYSHEVRVRLPEE